MTDLPRSMKSGSPELVDRWAALRQEYADLRLSLIQQEDQISTAAVLRRLAALRAEMSDINEQIHRSPKGPNMLHTPSNGSLPAPQAMWPDGLQQEPDDTTLERPVTVADRTPEHLSNQLRPEPANGVSEQLTVRFFVEGPPSAGTTTVMNQLADQFRAEMYWAKNAAGTLTANWFDFSTGVFDGHPIRFEVISFSGLADRATRHLARSIADVVVAVVDSAPDSMVAAYRYVSELLEHRDSQARAERPVLAVFAHKADKPNALHADLVAAELLVDSSIQVVSTKKESRGFLYGFALATGKAVKRVQERDDESLPRTSRLTFEEFLTFIGDRHLDSAEVGSSPPEAPEPGGAMELEHPAPLSRPPMPPRENLDEPRPPLPQPPRAEIGGNQAEETQLSFQPPERKPEPDSVNGGSPATPNTRQRASALRRLISALRNPATGR